MDRRPARSLARRRAGNERIIGVKLGLTSRAKQRRMGIDAPLTGWLTDTMQLEPEAPVPVSELIHPRVEPDIAFVLHRRLAGPGVTAAAALDSVGEVLGALEIIDSRYVDYRFTLPEVVADNASSARFVLGTVTRSPQEIDLPAESCVLWDGDTVAATATGAAVQGHPANALALAANALAARGEALEPGWIVLTGGMTDAIPLSQGRRITAEFAGLGRLTLTA